MGTISGKAEDTVGTEHIKHNVDIKMPGVTEGSGDSVEPGGLGETGVDKGTVMAKNTRDNRSNQSKQLVASLKCNIVGLCQALHQARPCACGMHTGA